MEWKIELIIVPVTDVDRAKDFYVGIGFHADHDASPTEDIRFVQLTPPGSACSIAIGKGLTKARPGSVDAIQIVVPDADEAHRHLVAAGVAATAVQDLDWGRFTSFTDPDGNMWSVQELPHRG
jgi:predicted enzyme related to lactoylglutathione lyase